VFSVTKVVVCEEYCTLECYAVYFVRNTPTFQTSLLPSSPYESTLIEEVPCSPDITPQMTVCRHYHEYLKTCCTPTKQIAMLLFCLSCFSIFGM